MESQELVEAKELTCSLSEEDCSLHGEQFELFCLEDKQPVCSVCRDTQEHVGHTFRPIREVAKSCKNHLEQEVYYMAMNHQDSEHYKEQFERTIEHIESQAGQTEQQIKQQFEKLHQFLRDEEEATITALREEEEQKKKMMKEKLKEMVRHISVLSSIINDSEEKMEDDDFCFLKEFPILMERIQNKQPTPQTPSGALIDVSRYLGNLSFRVWKKMQDIVQNTPVILDPNTAHLYLILSDDLTSVRNTKIAHHLPDNPERFYCFYCVLGSEGFNSGTHSWDVEVRKSPSWSLGVTTASNNRRSGFFFSSNVWSVRYSLNVESGYSVDVNLDRVRVYLDCDGGTVSFSDPVTNTHLHTFTTTFTDTVFPFFCCNWDSSLRILPFSSQ